MSREKLIYALIDLIRENQVLNDFLDQTSAAYLGVNRTDANAIDVIERHGRVTAGDLARELRLTTGAVTTVVDRLERAGYARRVADPDDRRRVLLEVTPVVRQNGELIYGKAEEGLAYWSEFTEAELDVVRRYEEMSRRWLDDRLAKLDELIKERPLPTTTRGTRGPRGKKELRGRGRT
jgi:DNA-binding MarR family transcriptional regulator